jgi:uncharacterized protein YbjT (DUF2867 family)
MLVVTGPTGNVGTELSSLLVDLGDDAPPFRLAAHTPAKLLEAHGPDVPVARLDYGDPSTFDEALDGVSTLFLLFPLPHPRTARTWMRPLIDAAVEQGAKHVIYVSVPGADRQKVVPHHVVERHLGASGVGHTILRPTYFAQNLVRAISTHGVDIAEHGELFVPGRDGLTTFVDARDVAEVAALVARDPGAHDGASYVLAGPESLSFGEAADTLSDVLDRDIRYTDPSMPRFWRRMRRRGVTLDTIFFMTIVYTLARRNKNRIETDELERLLGRAPRSFRDFAEDHRWRWEQQAWT